MVAIRKETATQSNRKRSTTNTKGMQKWWLRACFVSAAIVLSLPTLVVLPSSDTLFETIYGASLSQHEGGTIVEHDEARRGLNVRGSEFWNSANDDASDVGAEEASILKMSSEEENPSARGPNQGSQKFLGSNEDEEDEAGQDTEMTMFPPTRQDWRGYYPNRTIAFVHVGKSGGLTLRQSTSLICRITKKGRESTEAQQQPCIDKKFPADATLSRQTKYYLHMHGYNPDEMDRSTSFLLTLRHPVDRLISTFRYSHPANCQGVLKTRQYSQLPWGCHIERRSNGRGKPSFQIWKRCYPSAAMEDFAQQILSPFPAFNSTSHFVDNRSSEYMKRETERGCRKAARDMVRGKGYLKPSPHMYYNYEYYISRTLDLYPTKEVFAVRTDHEWEDLRELDLAIGGGGTFMQEGRHVSHGSEYYSPSPLSTEAYQKLCCVLEQEIANYEKILQRVLNFNQTVKDECMEKVKESCGIETSLRQWRKECRAHMEKDDQLLEGPNAPATREEALEIGREFAHELRLRLNLTNLTKDIIAAKSQPQHIKEESVTSERNRKHLIGPSFQKMGQDHATVKARELKKGSVATSSTTKQLKRKPLLHQELGGTLNQGTQTLKLKTAKTNQDLHSLSPATKLKIAEVLRARASKRRGGIVDINSDRKLRFQKRRPSDDLTKGGLSQQSNETPQAQEGDEDLRLQERRPSDDLTKEGVAAASQQSNEKAQAQKGEEDKKLTLKRKSANVEGGLDSLSPATKLKIAQVIEEREERATLPHDRRNTKTLQKKLNDDVPAP